MTTTKKKTKRKVAKKVTKKAVSKPTVKRKAKKKATKNPVGQQPKYTDAIWKRILLGLCEGRSLRAICRDKGIPTRQTIYNWCADNTELFDQYARAKEIGIDEIVEEAIEIADDGTNDYNEEFDKDGLHAGWKVNTEAIQRSRVRVDVRKWYASKLKSKTYGDKSKLVTDDGEGGDAPINELGETERLIRLNALVNAAKARKEKDDE